MFVTLLRAARLHLAFLAMTATVLTTGCATTAKSTWFDPRTANAPYDTVLVVGIMPGAHMHRDIERQMIADISTGKTTAYS